MLILSGKVGEEIAIGDGITLVVKAIRGKQVSLGIKAPPNVGIRRQELGSLPHPSEPKGLASEVSEPETPTSAE